MNVAIFELAQPSLIVADLINHSYGEWFEKTHGEPFNIVAFTTGGGGIPLQVSETLLY